MQTVAEISKKSFYKVPNINIVFLEKKALDGQDQSSEIHCQKKRNTLSPLKYSDKSMTFDQCPSNLCREYAHGIGYTDQRLLHRQKFIFDPGLTKGVPCNHPCPSLRLSIHLSGSTSMCLSLNISETAHDLFLIFGMNLGQYKATKVTKARFLKKTWGL